MAQTRLLKRTKIVYTTFKYIHASQILLAAGQKFIAENLADQLQWKDDLSLALGDWGGGGGWESNMSKPKMPVTRLFPIPKVLRNGKGGSDLTFFAL